jgi:hypothetical protein
MTTGSTQAVGSSASNMPRTADKTATPTSICTNLSSNWSRSICHCVLFAACTSTFRPATSRLLVTSASLKPASGFAAKRVTVSVAVQAWALSASATVGNEMGAGVAEPPLNASLVLGRRRGSAAARPAHSSNARMAAGLLRVSAGRDATNAICKRSREPSLPRSGYCCRGLQPTHCTRSRTLQCKKARAKQI